jgi:hypothetical protein
VLRQPLAGPATTWHGCARPSLPFRKQKGTIRAGAITLADDEMVDQRSVRHVGLDNEGSALLNDLYCGEELDEARRARLPECRDPADVLERVRCQPVYLALAMTPAQRLGLTDTTC